MDREVAKVGRLRRYATGAERTAACRQRRAMREAVAFGEAYDAERKREAYGQQAFEALHIRLRVSMRFYEGGHPALVGLVARRLSQVSGQDVVAWLDAETPGWWDLVKARQGG